MLLNKIPVLDNGYVALIGSACPTPIFTGVLEEFFKAKHTDTLNKVCYATLAFKAPIFVQLYLAQNGLTMVSTRVGELQAYLPGVGEIGSGDHQTDRDISDDIARTTEALLINPIAYQKDKCDPFISQVIMPVSTYDTFLVGGSLEVWKQVYSSRTTPAPIKSYLLAVEQIIKVEWKHV